MSETSIFIITGFWVWMLVDCYQNEPNRVIWFWIVLFLYFPGALIYFFKPNSKSQPRKILHPLRRLQLLKELHKAKIGAKYIGKAHQYLILGNIFLELGEFERAEAAYNKALNKEPKNPYILWGAALVAFHGNRFAVASRHLELLLKIDPKHLQGDASILYAKVLFSLGKWAVAKSHLKEDIHYWGHPESTIMLAKIEIQDGKVVAAQNLLKEMLFKLKDAPTYHSRRHQQVIREAELILRNIPSPRFQQK